MKQYTVEITKEALTDMEQIYEYIAEVLRSPENAIQQYKRIANRIMKLSEFPERFPVMDSEPEQEKGLRKMPVNHYMVFYVVKEAKVIVTNVLYSSADITARLKGMSS